MIFPLAVAASARFFSPAETAKRLGVSVKALRVYEAHGLVAPARTQAGWRVYGPVEMARLHQVLALKRLGLPLSQELWAFVREVADGMRERGELPPRAVAPA